MEAARQLFERIVEGGIPQSTSNEELVNSQWAEDLLLEFKVVSENKAPMSHKDRQSLAEALSALTNCARR